MKYVYQKKYVDVRYPTHTDDKDNEVGETTTIASNDCGICSIIMALDRLFINNPMSMKKLIDLSWKSAYFFAILQSLSFKSRINITTVVYKTSIFFKKNVEF